MARLDEQFVQVQRTELARPGEEVRFALDSPLEGDGFELLVPRHKSRGFPQHSGHCGGIGGALKRYHLMVLGNASDYPWRGAVLPSVTCAPMGPLRQASSGRNRASSTQRSGA
jgi:hypothetical protein